MEYCEDDARFDGTNLVVGLPREGETYDARYLISTLLVYVAKSDGEISEQESSRMIDLLSTQLEIPGPEALERLRTAIMALSDDRDIVTRLQAIAHGLCDEQKFEILWMMLDVMVVDKKLQRSEIDAITLAGQVLGLPLDTIHAQLRAITANK
ncbi:MAG: TerB family tellurite resistance protein [Halioglobus sp.]|nr:TerB family tellurite resistance protein [Halioglobus sp.]